MPLGFDGSEGKAILLSQAVDMTTLYRTLNPGKVLSCFLGRTALETLLNQPNAKGIRFYYGLVGETPQLVAVSADAAENDQIGDGHIVVDEGVGGPPRGGLPNVLNS